MTYYSRSFIRKRKKLVKVAKKWKKKKKQSNLWAIPQCYQIECKFKCTKFLKPYTRRKTEVFNYGFNYVSITF
jgi:hypothetical protein